MPLQNITITASINSIATQSYGQKTYIASTDEQSFPIEEITGSYAGAWPHFVPPSLNISGNYTVGLVVNVTQSWSGSNVTPLGYVPYTHDTMEEFVNGEFSGSSYVVTDGNLTDDFCQQFLEVPTQLVEYSIFPYVDVYFNNVLYTSSLGLFLHRYTVPSPGQILMHYNDNYIGTPGDYDRATTIDYLKIARIDQFGNDNSLSLQELERIIWSDTPSPTGAGEINLKIININEQLDYYLYEVISKTWGNITYFPEDDNVLDYTLEATNFPTIIQGYNYLTSSWSTVIDAAGGFNLARGYYSFPLTPNCDIYTTASITLTLTTPATFSYAINAYDPIYPQTIPNALYSINNPLQFNTYTQSSAPNVFYLNAGTHNLSISGSSKEYGFIQEYQYKIDSYLENNNIAINENGLLSGSVFDPTPSNWESVESGSGSPISWTNDSAGSGWVSSQYFGGSNFPLSNGVIYYPDITLAPSVLRIPPTIGPEFPWVVGTTYNIDIYIPPSFGFSNLGTFGPSLAPLTCSTSLIDPISPSNIIGYIPSGSSGLISFTRTAIAADENFNIFAPLNAADIGNKIFPLVSWIRVYETGSALADIYWYVTQSQAPQLSTSSIVLEPYLYSNFYYSDCDVLINNFSQNEISSLVQEVLYDNGGTIPSNIEQIISGTAQQAEVNDYLYRASANTLPRYKGVRTTSQDFNLPSQNGLSNEELSFLPYSSSLIINNGVPNIENTTTYFAYFSELKPNYPIFKGTTSPVIKYLIREDGSTYSPSTDNISYYNLVGSFPRDTKAYANLLYETSTIFNTTQSVILSGESYTPILYNISASNVSVATFSDTLNFDNLQGTLSTTAIPVSYSLYLQKLNQNVDLSNGARHNVFYYGIDTTNFNDPGAGSWSGAPTYFSSNVYEPYYSFDGIPNTRVKVLFQLDSFTPGLISSNTLIMEIWKSNGGISQSIAQKTINLTGVYNTNPNSLVTWNVGNTADCIAEFTPAIGDEIFCTAKVLTPAQGAKVRTFSLKITTLGLNVPAVIGPFWFTGSVNSNILTSSLSLAQVMDGNYRQVDIPGSGFDPIELPCVPKIGDEIRFEYDESNTYRIVDTGLISGSGEFILTLDNIVPSISTLDINHFTIRRKVKDAITGIALDADLLSQVQDGFLLPEYPSQTIKSNISNIIQDLIQKGVI